MHSVFSLSSDPDSPPDTKTAKRDKTIKKGSRSSNIDNHVLDNTKTVDEGLLDQDEESPKVQASKVKPPKEKSLQNEDGKASKKMDDNTNGGEMHLLTRDMFSKISILILKLTHLPTFFTNQKMMLTLAFWRKT